MKLFFMWWLLCGVFEMPAARCEYSHWRAGQSFPQPLPQEIMVDAVNYIGMLLLNAHNQNNENNIAFSPYGAASVLVALGEGVQGEALDEILRSSLLPVDPSVMRVGLRDIHRHLKSYFIPQEGFLAGLTFSHNNVTLRPSYERILQFYGYDTDSFNNPLYPDPYSTSTITPSSSATGFPSPTDVENSKTTTAQTTSTTDMSSTSTEIPDVISENTNPIISTTDSTASATTFTSGNDISTISPVSESTIATLSDNAMPTTLTTIIPNDVTISTETNQETIFTTKLTLNEETALTTSSEAINTSTQTIRATDTVTTENQEIGVTTAETESTSVILSVTTIEPTTTSSTSLSLQDVTTPITTNQVSTVTNTADVLIDSTTTASPAITTAFNTESTISDLQSSTITLITDTTAPTGSTTVLSTEAVSSETTETVNTETVTAEITSTEIASSESTLASNTDVTRVADTDSTIENVMSSPITLANNLVMEPATDDNINPIILNMESVVAENSTEAQKNRRMAAYVTDIKMGNSFNFNNKSATARQANQELYLYKSVKNSLGGKSNYSDDDDIFIAKKDIFHRSSESLVTVNSSSANFDNNVNVSIFTKKINDGGESNAALNFSSPAVKELNRTVEKKEDFKEEKHTDSKLTLEELFPELKDDFEMNSKELNETKVRQTRSVIDYLIAKYHDNHPPHNYFTGNTAGYEPEKPTTFAVNGKVREPNINFMTYDTVLPYRYVSYLNALALTFPLDSNSYYLLLVLPIDETGIDTLVSKMMTTTLKRIIYSLQPTRVKATIPSFMLKGYVVLTPSLQKLGIRRIFEPRHADFSRMTADKDIYVTNIEQAVTVTIRNYIDPSILQNSGQMLRRHGPVRFTADHPFLYFVMDSRIHVALMAGKIINPLNSRIR